jgi:hypothetical protein
MGMQILWTFIFVNRMHRGACVEYDCSLKTPVRAGSVFTVCRTRRVAEDGSEYDYKSVTSSPKSIGLLSYFSSSFLFYLLPLLTCAAVQYILSHAPDYGEVYGFLSWRVP